MTDAARAEEVDRQERDAFGVEQEVGEARRAEPAPAHVEEHEHAALGRPRDDARNAGQRVDDEARATLVRGADRRRDVRVGERDDAGVLDERRAAEEHALEKLLERLHELDRADGPAVPEAGHRVRLRQAGEHGDAVVDALEREHAGELDAVGERRVDLVADEPEVVRAAELRDAPPARRASARLPSGCAGCS